MIQIHPNIGAVLRCDYEPGFKTPEMIKRRPVIVVSPRLRNRDGLCTVVPLSGTQPSKVMPYHCQVVFDPPLPPPYDSGSHWVKADMIATVGFHRLYPLVMGKDQYGKRKYDNRLIDKDKLQEIHACIRHALGMES
jgi:uncharacterized protein YifN (PemK superfamily)